MSTSQAVFRSKFDIVGAVQVANALAYEQLGVEEHFSRLDLEYLDRMGMTAKLPGWRKLAAALDPKVEI